MVVYHKYVFSSDIESQGLERCVSAGISLLFLWHKNVCPVLPTSWSAQNDVTTAISLLEKKLYYSCEKLGNKIILFMPV